MSALAGTMAALVALIAYLVPSPRPQPGPVIISPAPRPPSSESVVTPPTSPEPTPSSEPDTPWSPAPSPVRATPITSSPPAIRPGGCDEATTALASYGRDGGATRGGQAAAAHQTYLDLMSAGLDAQGAVGATISRLAAEFRELNFRLTGMTGGDPNQVITDINTDIAEFRRLCGSG
ncbi:hypothetical protein ACFQ08_13545 [Streptosporangium algeriense]|uniref:Uncharacterized protein n=1 Tax=Streptosporangium algeriense TaxID=1682748 RepID=A0ABW3DP35_9ACTN